MAQDVIALDADPKLSNALMAVKIAGEIAMLVLTVQTMQRMAAGAPPAAVFWERVRQVSQRAALQLGKLGLYAEARYQEMIK